MDKFNSITQQSEEILKENEKILEDLSCQTAELGKEVVELKKELDIKNNELMQMRGIVADLTKENQFLKGSIDAYQYCLNCRR